MTINSTIISGYHALQDVRYLLQGKRQILVVTDAHIVNIAVVQTLLEHIQRQTQTQIIQNIPPEPSHLDLQKILDSVTLQHVDMVIGIGGGSVLDSAKLLAVLQAEQTGISLDSLLAGQKPATRTPLLLIPTTAGTGSEATPNAILAIPEKQTKVGVISPVMLPDYVALIPEFTTSMPAKITASTGADALCHLIECFTSVIANPVSDNYALIGLKKLFATLETAYREPENMSARLEMLWASYYGGAAIAHAGTHLIHAMSYPLGGKYHIPHGVANAILLVPCMRFLQPVLTDKFAQTYDLLPHADASLTSTDKASRLVGYFEHLMEALALPQHLSELGIQADQIPSLTQGALDVQRLIKNVPMAISREHIQSIYASIA